MRAGQIRLGLIRSLGSLGQYVFFFHVPMPLPWEGSGFRVPGFKTHQWIVSGLRNLKWIIVRRTLHA